MYGFVAVPVGNTTCSGRMTLHLRGYGSGVLTRGYLAPSASTAAMLFSTADCGCAAGSDTAPNSATAARTRTDTLRPRIINSPVDGTHKCSVAVPPAEIRSSI